MYFNNLLNVDSVKKILIADDHNIFRNALKEYLHMCFDVEVVGEAENGQDAVVNTTKLHPDIVLMDICMPQMNGIEACHIIKSKMPEVKVFLYSFDTELVKVCAGRENADDIFPKDEIFQKLKGNNFINYRKE